MKRRTRGSSVRFAGERDLINLTRSLGDLLRPASLVRQPSMVDLVELEDRRLFVPGTPSLPSVPAYRPAKARNRAATRLTVRRATQVATPPRFERLGPFVAFAEPRSVALCIRRQRRRQVMHALDLAGRRGVGRGRPRRRNEFSSVSCR